MVWLDSSNLQILNVNQKLKEKCEGPFEITKVMGHGVYELELPQKWCIHPVFHAILLFPYNETDYPRPPPDILEQGESYEIKAIVVYQKGCNENPMTSSRPL